MPDHLERNRMDKLESYVTDLCADFETENPNRLVMLLVRDFEKLCGLQVYFDALPQPRTQPPKDNSGYVYVLEAGGKYKIGRTKSPRVRFKAYTREIDIEVLLLWETDDCIALEKQMLKLFPAKRVGNTEWFDLSAEELDEVIKIAKASV